jgi:drug/metabolite transporter (DMT)-like permease
MVNLASPPLFHLKSQAHGGPRRAMYMSDSVLFLLICASAGHAIWNALSRKVSERDQFYTIIIVIAVIVYAPIAIHLSLTTQFPMAALPWLIGSILAEIIYFIFLAKAYKKGTFLTVYPVARGSAPLITTIFSFLLLDKSIGSIAFAGIILVVLGILLINQTKLTVAMFQSILKSPGTGSALLTGICTATYSVCDSEGAVVMSPILYKYVVFTGLCIGKLIIDHSPIQSQKQSYAAIFKKYRYRAVIGGFLIFGVNAIVVYTMKFTPVALVATVRELSIVFASIIGVLWLKEKLTIPKIVSISLIIAGVLLIRG